MAPNDLVPCTVLITLANNIQKVSQSDTFFIQDFKHYLSFQLAPLAAASRFEDAITIDTRTKRVTVVTTGGIALPNAPDVQGALPPIIS